MTSTSSDSLRQKHPPVDTHCAAHPAPDLRSLVARSISQDCRWKTRLRPLPDQTLYRNIATGVQSLVLPGIKLPHVFEMHAQGGQCDDIQLLLASDKMDRALSVLNGRMRREHFGRRRGLQLVEMAELRLARSGRSIVITICNISFERFLLDLPRRVYYSAGCVGCVYSTIVST